MFKDKSSLQNVAELHREAMSWITSKYRDRFRDKLVSVYLYGSVARGTARPNSDIDNIAIVDMPVEEVESEANNSWRKELRQEFKLNFPTIWDIDIHPISTISASNNDWIIMMKADGILVAGEDFYQDKSIPTDPKVFVQALFKRYYDNIIRYWKKFVSESNHTEADIVSLSRIFAKVSLRLGMALAIVEQQDIRLFTNDVETQKSVIDTWVPDFADLANLAYQLRYTENKDQETFVKLGTQLQELMDKLEPYMDFN